MHCVLNTFSTDTSTDARTGMTANTSVYSDIWEIHLLVAVCLVVQVFLPASRLPFCSLCTGGPTAPAQDPPCWPRPATLNTHYFFTTLINTSPELWQRTSQQMTHKLFYSTAAKVTPNSARKKNQAGDNNIPVQFCALQCVGSALYLSSTRADSRCPRQMASSSGVRPRGSSRSKSCCWTHTHMDARAQNTHTHTHTHALDQANWKINISPAITT